MCELFHVFEELFLYCVVYYINYIDHINLNL